jgi:biotin carboxyl carrier protein
MPGKVVRILVNQGDTVEPRQGLIVVEAMKMQNEMKSPKAGTVVEIKTKDGATVSAGEILIVIE